MKRFSILIIVRIVLLVANVLVISVIFGDKRLFFNQIILGLILIIQVAELIRFVNHTNRELSKFFYAIKHSDFSISFKQSALGQSFKDLEKSMSDIVQSYKQVKIEKEAQFHLLQLLVNQLHIGIIAVEEESITLVNPTAEKMADIKGIRNWKLVQQLNPRFTKEIEQIGENGKKLIEMKTGSESYFTSADVRTLLILDKPMKLITLQNIDSEIEQKEIEAWHKLIRILTHEIMNSVTPISSLTETMQSMLQHRNGNEKVVGEIEQETISDIRFSLKTIHKRTDGLMQFVDNYRSLTRVPKPALSHVQLKEYILDVVKLMEHQLAKNDVALRTDLQHDIHLNIDPMLIEQVLINIITNAIHALEQTSQRTIDIRSFIKDKHVIIEIADNGKGIPPKELSEIFIPFFTTKKEGSGIGLSLSKQIMSQHGGAIRVKSEVGVGTVFSLHFSVK